MAARVTALAGQSLGTRHLRSLLAAEADIQPHQLAPALAILAGYRRVLVADEVGLGKTIQAALIVSELRARDVSLRALLLVPTSLQGQWATELQRRFGIATCPGDRLGLERTAREAAPGANPWARSGVWMASLDSLKQPHVFGALPPQVWDLVVVDEAHDACGASDRHAACAALAQRARRLVLLTATPHSGDEARFERLMSLGACRDAKPRDATGPPLDGMLVFRRTRAELACSPARRVRWHLVRPTDAEARLLAVLRQFERFVLDRSRREVRDAVPLFLSILRKRALSTAMALTRTLDRRLAWLDDPAARRASDDWTQRSFDFSAPDEDSEDVVGLRADLGIDSSHERTWLGRLRQIAQEAARGSSKLRHLARLLRRTTEPAVVFTEFRDSLDAVVRALPEGCTAALLHGGQSDPERQVALARFLNGHVRVLAATDVAAQGLNLQSRARWVVSLELPWRPSRLEQRVGRVDRIGQPRVPHLSLLVSSHPMESSLLARLARQALVAATTLGASVLHVVNPAEPAVAAALLVEDPPPTGISLPRADAVRLSHAFDRPTRRLARQLRVCRRARRAWCGSVEDVHRPWMSSGALAASRSPDGDATLVVLAGLVNDQDHPVEQHVLEVRIRGCDLGQLDRLTHELRSCVAQWLGPRARRLATRLRRLDEIDRAQRRAVERNLARTTRASTQPGLFHGRLSMELDRIALERSAVTPMASVARRDDSAPNGPETPEPGCRVTLAPLRLVAIVAPGRKP